MIGEKVNYKSNDEDSIYKDLPNIKEEETIIATEITEMTEEAIEERDMKVDCLFETSSEDSTVTMLENEMEKKTIVKNEQKSMSSNTKNEIVNALENEDLKSILE